MTYEQTGGILAVLAAAWPHRDAPDAGATATAYHLAWEDLPLRSVERAVKEWMQTGKFFPAPSEIRALALPHCRWMLGDAYWLGRSAAAQADGSAALDGPDVTPKADWS